LVELRLPAGWQLPLLACGGPAIDGLRVELRLPGVPPSMGPSTALALFSFFVCGQAFFVRFRYPRAGI